MRKTGIMLLSLFMLSSCWPSRISFIDGSLPEDWKTFYVVTLENNSSNTPLNYPVDLSERIKDGLQNNTRLQLNQNEADSDVLIEGVIQSYNITPVAVQEGDFASKNRLSVTVQFTILTKKPEEKESNLVSTKFIDYNANTDLGVVENTLLSEVSEQIVQDVLNKLLSNW